MLLGRRVGDEDVDDSERQHRADFLVRQTGSKELLLSDLKFRQKIMKDMPKLSGFVSAYYPVAPSSSP